MAVYILLYGLDYFFCVSSLGVRPRFSTIVSVSRDRVSRLEPTLLEIVYLALIGLDTLPTGFSMTPTCRSSFGRSPCLKTYVMSDMGSVLEIL